MRIVCIGDSITYGYGVLPKKNWPYLLKKKYKIELFNKGINGDTTRGMRYRFNRDVISYNPDKVIILGGVNDFFMEIPLEKVKKNMETMINRSIENNIEPIIGIPIKVDGPMASKEWADDTNYNETNNTIVKYRKWIIEYCTNNNLRYIDFYKTFETYVNNENLQDYYTDGVHLTNLGNELFLNTIEL